MTRRRALLLAAGFTALILLSFSFGVAVARMTGEGPAEPAAPDGYGQATAGVAVGRGDVFTFLQYDFAEGWEIAEDKDGKPTIRGMRITNTGTSQETPALSFELVSLDGAELYATVSCFGFSFGPGGTIEVGPWQCAGEGPMPDREYQVVVKDMDAGL
jgi:hypothetical protein